MNKFEFDHNNNAQIEMPILMQSELVGNKHFSSIRESNRNKGVVKIGFFGEESCWEYENIFTEPQSASLEFIKTNQAEILDVLFHYVKDDLYPEHIGYIGYDEVSFPTLSTVNDLRKALGIHTISLFNEHKDGLSYYGLSCDFSGDFEHGVNIIMHKLSVLGWEENMGKDKVLKDLNT